MVSEARAEWRRWPDIPDFHPDRVRLHHTRYTQSRSRCRALACRKCTAAPAREDRTQLASAKTLAFAWLESGCSEPFSNTWVAAPSTDRFPLGIEHRPSPTTKSDYVPESGRRPIRQRFPLTGRPWRLRSEEATPTGPVSQPLDRAKPFGSLEPKWLFLDGYYSPCSSSLLLGGKPSHHKGRLLHRYPLATRQHSDPQKERFHQD